MAPPYKGLKMHFYFISLNSVIFYVAESVVLT